MLYTRKKAKVTLNDEEGHFGHQVAATLRRYTPRQRAIAKLTIQQVLTDIEFSQDITTLPMSYSLSIPTNCYNEP